MEFSSTPISPFGSAQFRIGFDSEFEALVNSLMDLCPIYGDAGTELITDVEFQLDEPKITDVDSSDAPIYQLAYHAGRGALGDSVFIAERWGQDYTHASEMRFHYDHLNWENKITEYKKKKGGLLQVLLSVFLRST